MPTNRNMKKGAGHIGHLCPEEPDRKVYELKKDRDRHLQKQLKPKRQPPFFCSDCETTCSNYSNLMRHMKIHEGLKPYRCGCGKEFRREDNLDRHKDKLGHKVFYFYLCFLLFTV